MLIDYFAIVVCALLSHAVPLFQMRAVINAREKICLFLTASRNCLAACSVAVLRGVVFSWRHSGSQVCDDDGDVSIQAVYVRHPAGSVWKVRLQVSHG